MPKLATTTVPVLLGFATVIALISFFSHLIFIYPLEMLRPTEEPIFGYGSTFGNKIIFFVELVLGYVPLALGAIYLGVGYSAYRSARHKLLTAAYVVSLTPFAFNYPAWLIFLWIAYKSGRYHGPMP